MSTLMVLRQILNTRRKVSGYRGMAPDQSGNDITHLVVFVLQL